MVNYVEHKGLKFFFHTTYFYRLRFFKDKINYVPVSICIWDPKWIKNLIKYKPFVPTKYDKNTDCEACAKQHQDDPLYNGNLKCKYIENYRNQLNHLNFEEEINNVCDLAISFLKEKYDFIPNSTKEIHIMFVGYEIPAKKCSERFILSEWINNHYNSNFCNEI